MLAFVICLFGFIGICVISIIPTVDLFPLVDDLLIGSTITAGVGAGFVGAEALYHYKRDCKVGARIETKASWTTDNKTYKGFVKEVTSDNEYIVKLDNVKRTEIISRGDFCKLKLPPITGTRRLQALSGNRLISRLLRE